MDCLVGTLSDEDLQRLAIEAEAIGMRGASVIISVLLAVLTASSVYADAFADVALARERASKAVTPVNVLILDVRYASGQAMSESLARAKKYIELIDKLMARRKNKELTLADEFLLFNLLNRLGDNLSSLSESLRNVDGAFGDRRPNSLAGEWNEAVQDAVSPVFDAALSVDEHLYSRLEKADEALGHRR